MNDILLICFTNHFWSQLLWPLEPRFALSTATAFNLASPTLYACSAAGSLTASYINLALGYLLAKTLFYFRPALKEMRVGSGAFRRLASYALLLSPLPSMGSAFTLLSGICRPYLWGVLCAIPLAHILYFTTLYFW